MHGMTLEREFPGVETGIDGGGVANHAPA
jgi:hypothetical protein